MHSRVRVKRLLASSLGRRLGGVLLLRASARYRLALEDAARLLGERL